MGRRTIVRSQAAELKQKRQLRDAGDAVLGPAPSGEQVIVDKGTSSPAEENNQPSGLSVLSLCMSSEMYMSKGRELPPRCLLR